MKQEITLVMKSDGSTTIKCHYCGEEEHHVFPVDLEDFSKASKIPFMAFTLKHTPCLKKAN